MRQLRIGWYVIPVGSGAPGLDTVIPYLALQGLGRQVGEPFKERVRSLSCGCAVEKHNHSLNSLPSVHTGLPWKGQSLQDQQRPQEAKAAE